MADAVEFSVLKVVFDSLASPAVEKILEIWDLENDIGELKTTLTTEAEAVVEVENDNNVYGGRVGLRFELKNSAYDAEDLIHYLTIIAANLIHSGDQRSERYLLDLDLDLDLDLNLDLDGVAS